VKKILWSLLATIVLLGTLGEPVQLHADGGSPTCPTGKTCKP